MTTASHTALKTSPYGTGSGLLVEPAAGTALDAIDSAKLLELLKQAGFLLLRGFDTDMTSFTALVQNTSTSTTLDPARDFYSDVAQKVDAGLDEVGLHTENGNSPFRSHLAWFFCEKAATSGSQTTVCDGYRVWEALSPAAREAFSAQDIVYSRYVSEPQWRGMAHHLMGRTKPAEEIQISELLALTGTLKGTEIVPEADGGIRYSYTTPAADSTVFGTRPSFANSILGPSFNYEKPKITFADGTEFSPELLAEVEAVTAALTENLDWQHGDVAVIDNTRVMHGRRAITDPDRTIYNALSYIAVPAAA
ncbi:TauD/TfdA family dioxygenase [Streptomyces sp. HUAS TT20]|uniref:TauD/TfdA family dioxygenase n=1 Tax=Streptomyces sp. HUAS TT20 TaxID=3447509 RepID=UPI0021DAC2FC|nr:TauD/TfdA family dioxygenase [Streptomyces sp. HUAS 15-9]UXY33066.1 TauD/TfdA family dioxygenase [Streptomyces sp. HUAS 15-9]